MKAGQWPEAQVELSAWVKEFAGDAAAHTNLGVVYARTGRKDLAGAEFVQASVLDPHNAAAQDWLGVLAREMGDLRQAEQAYRRALEADPADADAHLNLGVLYERYLNRPADALQEYRAYREQGDSTDVRAAVWIADLERMMQQKGSGT